MDNKLSKDITEKLEIRNLSQVFEKDLKTKNFTFLGLGKLILTYKFDIVEGDAFASRLAGCDNNYQIKRTGLKHSYISLPTPKDSTHYYLGEIISDEELYLEHKDNSSSRDLAPIVFLKEN